MQSAVVAKDAPIYGDFGDTYLGQFGETVDGNKFEYDLWYCSEGVPAPTIVARFGPGQGAYLSGLYMGWSGRIPALVEARRRAEQLGLEVNKELHHPFNMPCPGDICFWLDTQVSMGVEHYDGKHVRVWLNGEIKQIPRGHLFDIDRQPIDWVGLDRIFIPFVKRDRHGKTRND